MMGNSEKVAIEGVKVSGYQSDYIESSNIGSYEDTSKGSNVDHVKRHCCRSKFMVLAPHWMIFA